MVSESARKIIEDGSIKVRVRRTGMLQVITLQVRRVSIGGTHFVELYFKRVLDRNELARVANELGLPVEAENGRAFPEGKGAKDFLDL